MAGLDVDTRVRLAAFEFLREQTELHGHELRRDVLARGFTFEGQQVPLLSPQGIFKPAVLPEVPLSITTAPPSDRKPAIYDDRLDQDGVLTYRYRGSELMHRDNVGLRLAMLRSTPLVYFFGIVPGRYDAIWPVFIVGDDPDRLTFTAVADDSAFAHMDGTPTDIGADGRRRYITTLVQGRLHQQAFRERVLLACSNALCTLHHAAFDRQVLGVRPDLIVEVRSDVLREADGPMLLHGLQGFQGAPLTVPRREDQRPNRDFLAERYDLFLKAG
jgi:putative restriction endonuclease